MPIQDTRQLFSDFNAKIGHSQANLPLSLSLPSSSEDQIRKTTHKYNRMTAEGIKPVTVYRTTQTYTKQQVNERYNSIPTKAERNTPCADKSVEN